MTTHQNLTDETYWSARWRREAAPPAPVNVRDRSIGNTVVLAWDAYFRRALAGLAPGSRLLEIGCAQAGWLPYFFGVVEHFRDTAACVRACARLLSPGGRMVTTIPNMGGSIGLLQRRLDREVYATHVPLRPAELAAAHRQAGLEVESCRYVMLANWRLTDGAAGVTRAWQMVLKAASKAVWLLERYGLPAVPNPLTSPYIACTATRPG